MAIKQPALIAARDNRKKKKEKELLKPTTAKTTVSKPKTITVKSNDKGKTYVDRSTISKKPTVQNTTQNRIVTNKDRLTSKSNFGGINNDIRTVKTTKKSKPKQNYSVGTYDIYKRDGRYYYNDGKEKEIDKNFVEKAIKDKKTGVIGNYDSKGQLRTTDSRGNVKAPEKNLLKNIARVGKGVKLGGEKGAISIASKELQDLRSDLDKGEKIKKPMDYLSQISNIIYNSDPRRGMGTAIKNAANNTKELWKDNEKKTLDKVVGTFSEAAHAGLTGERQGIKDAATLWGAVLPKDTDKKVEKLERKINEPINKKLEKFEEEKENYSNIVNRSADIGRTVGNMLPGIGASVITRNPDLGILATMASVRGQSTERAEKAGKNLDEAIKYGDLMSAIEGGTEYLSGGLKVFGKGPKGNWLKGGSESIDDVVMNAINAKVTNPALNFALKSGAGITGEQFEEVLSDILGTVVDIGTIDPNATYTLEDLKRTLLDTGLSTIAINALTGGYGSGAYNSNINDMNNFNIQQQQANEINQRVQSGEIDDIEGLALLDQVKDGTYQKNRNLEQIATQESQRLKQAAQQGIISQEEYTQGLQALTNTVNQTREEINTPQQETTNSQQESTEDSTINNETKVKQVENKSDLKEVVDEDLYNVDIKDVENQIYRENYKLNEDVEDEEGPTGNYWDIDDTYFELKDGNTLWIETPPEYVKYKNGKTNYSKEIHNKINIFIEDANGNIIEEKTLNNEKGEFTREDIINEIKSLTYDDSNKQAEGQIDMFGNVHVGKISDKVETNQNENRINDHTLEYNGYYIMSEKPNVGYEYKSLEESPRYQIYDANNDDITHNVANWVNSIDEAKQYIDNIKKLDNNTKTTKNENIPATKSENVISEEIKPQKQETTNETVNQNKETQQETTETQQQESKGPEILDKMPKDQTSKWEKFKKGFNRLRHHFTDHREAWYDASRKFKNPALNSRADAVDVARDKAMVDIGRAQVDYNSKRYNNFVDENGNKVSMSFEKAYDIYNKIPVKVKNEYLVHWLNVDRLNQGVDQFGIPLQESLQKIQELENEYKDIGKWSENIYQYYRNLGQKMVDSGRVSQDKMNSWWETTPHYVHIQRQVDNQSGNGVSTKGGKVDSSNLIQHVKGSTKPILPIKQTTSDFTIKAMNAIQLNNLAKEWAKTAGVGSTSNNIEDINDMDDIFGIDEKVFSDNGNGNYSIVAYDKGAVVDIPITKEMYEGLKPRDLRNLPTSKVTKVQRNLTTNKNPVFGLITNPIKDLQAMHFYSKFSAALTAKTYTKLFSGRTIGKAFESNPNKVTTQDWVNLYYDAGNAANSPYNNGEFTSEIEANKGKIRKGLSKLGDFIEKGNNFMESMPRITEFVNTIESEGYTINKGDGPTLIPMKGKNPTKSVEQVIMEASHNAAEITVNFKRGGTWAKNFDKNFAPYSSPALQGASKFTRNITEAIGDAKQGDFRAATRVISRAAAMGLAPAILNGIIYGDDDDYEELQDYQKDRYYLLKGEWFGSKEKWIRIPRGREISTIQTLARRTGNAAKGKEKAYKGYGKFAIDQVGPVNPIDSNVLAPIAGAYVFNRSWSGNKIVPDSLKDADAKNQYNEKTDELSKSIGKKLNISPMKLNYVLDQYSGVLGDVGLPYITSRANNNTNNPLAAIIKDKYTFDQANSSKNVSDFYDFKRELKKSDKEEDKLKGQLMRTKAKELFALTNKKQEIQMDSNLSKKDKYEQALEMQKEINKYAKEITKEVKDADVNIEKNSATVGNHVYHKDKDGEWAAESEKTTKNREKLGLSPEEYYYYKNEESYTPPGGEKSTSITSGKYAKQTIAIVDAFNFDPSDYLEYRYKLSKIRGDKDSRGRTIRYSARNKKIKYLNSLPLSGAQKAYLLKQNDKYYRSSDSSLKKAISNSNLSNKEKKEIYSYLKLGR